MLKRQFEARYSNFDAEKHGNVIFKQSNAATMQEFMQEETIESIIDWIHSSRHIILTGSIEMCSQMHTFQKNMVLMGKPVFLDPQAFKIGSLWSENDFYLCSTMTGRLLELEPELYTKMCRLPKCIFISQKDMQKTTLKIFGSEEGFASYDMLRFYLDQILYEYWRRYGYVSG